MKTCPFCAVLPTESVTPCAVRATEARPKINFANNALQIACVNTECLVRPFIIMTDHEEARKAWNHRP